MHPLCKPVLPSISVVIPTRQRAESLLRVLEALAGQQDVDQQRVEVVVVCDGVEDPAFEAVQRGWYPMRLRLADQQQQGSAAARNHALALSTGQLIVFLDDNAIPSAHFLSVHQQAHQNDDKLAAIGPLLALTDHATPWVRWERRTAAEQYHAASQPAGEVSPRQFSTGNASVRRAHLVNAFGFDVSFARGDDIELAFRLRDRGLHFVFLPEAAAEHHPDRSYASWVERAETWGHFEVRMGRDRGHRDLLDTLAREFQVLHPMTRWLGRASMRRPALARAVAGAARPVALLADRLHAPGLAEAALGASFNAVRLAGFAAEVGGPRPALSLLYDRGGWPSDATMAPAAPESQASQAAPRPQA